MDPISILASIAGIATAGTQLSKTLFRLFETVRNAPRDIQRIAKEMSGLTATLEHLCDIIEKGQLYTKPLFFDGVRHVINNIQATQQEISKMVTDQTVFARIRWLKSARFLSDIDKHKVTLTLQITVLSAAVLVKSNEGSSIIKERADNRFTLQAESLIQIGQASLQRDNTQRHIPNPPERAPSPPVRTTKRLPSPVRQSEIPGHIRTDEWYGQSCTTGGNLDVPKEDNDENDSAMVRSRGQPEYRPESVQFQDDGEEDAGYDERYSRDRSQGFDPLSGGRIAQFGRHFHVQGDAATFLYNLVFMTEVVAYKSAHETPSSTGATQGEHSEGSLYTDDDFHETVSDVSDDSTRHRKGRVGTTRNVYRKPQEPGRVVNHLLLTWTTLSQSEIEKGTAGSLQPSTNKRSPKVAYVEDAYESEDERMNNRGSRANWFDQAQVSRPDSPNSETSRNIKVKLSDPDPLEYIRASRRRRSSRGYFTPPPRTAPYEPHMNPSQFNYHYPNYQPYGPRSYPYTAPTWNHVPQPTAQPTAQDGLALSAEAAKAQEPVKPKFQKPHVVVIPRADTADSEFGSMTPKLDVSPCLKMSIVRQGEEAVWNCDEFATRNSIPGKAIMASLIGDKSARNTHGLDLAHTLIQGQDMKFVYVRGNDLGETWFINEQPVFLQFFHCGYLPQFYPTKEADIRAMRQDYVAIGEEWAGFEALNQLGLSVKGREEGWVLLDPGTTWSMVKELATTTLQLRSMRQRRLYTSTFYNSISTFRQQHIGMPLESPILNALPHITSDARPEVKLEVSRPDALSFLVKDEDYQVKEDVKAHKDDTKSLQPQISITPPPTPQEVTTPKLDTSDIGSTMSSRSRFSRLMQRCKPGRRHNLLSPSLQHSNSKSSEDKLVIDNSEDDDKRPVTPTDSGIGSSIA